MRFAHRIPSVVWVAAFAAAVRLCALATARHAPFWSMPMVDERGYMELAMALANGQGPPLGAYYVAPGYAYFLAAILRLGGDIVAVKLLQMAAGVASAALVCILGRRYFGTAAGVVAGCLWALVPAALLHELLLLKPALTVLCVLAALTLIARPAGARVWQWLTGGLALGCAALLRGEMALLGLLLAGGGLWARRRGWPGAPAPAGPLLCLVVLAAALAVPTVENVRRGGGFVVLAYGGGPNFYIGNNARADGGYRPLRPDRSDALFEERDAVELARQAEGRALTPAQVSRYWWRQGLAWWRAAPLPAILLTLKKSLLLWGGQEQADVISTGIAARWVPLLYNPVVRSGFLLPLALVGLWLHRRRRELWPMWVALLALHLSLTFFFIFERFRLPLVAVSLPFGGATLTAAATAWRARSRRSVLAGTAVVALLALLLALPRIERDEALLRVNIGGMLLRLQRYDEALHEFLTVRRELPAAGRVDINLATTYHLMGKPDEALHCLDRALRFLDAEAARTGRPSIEELVYCHELAGDLERRRGRADLAAGHYEEALRFSSGEPRLAAKLRELASERHP